MTARADFASQDYFRDPGAAIEKRAVPATAPKKSRLRTMSVYLRMKSGPPRIRAAWSAGGAWAMASRVGPVMVEPKIAARCAASTMRAFADGSTPGAREAPLAPLTGRPFRANAVAKLTRRVVASGLSQASSVFL